MRITRNLLAQSVKTDSTTHQKLCVANGLRGLTDEAMVQAESEFCTAVLAAATPDQRAAATAASDDRRKQMVHVCEASQAAREVAVGRHRASSHSSLLISCYPAGILQEQPRKVFPWAAPKLLRQHVPAKREMKYVPVDKGRLRTMVRRWVETPDVKARYGALASVNVVAEPSADIVFYGHSTQEQAELFVVFHVELAAFKLAWAGLRDNKEGMVYTSLTELITDYDAKAGAFTASYE